MRVLFRSAPVLVSLSVALAGCSQSGDAPAKKASGDGGSAAPSPAAGLGSPSSADYVLTVEGMK